jgi:hypothetical protein
MTALHPAAMNGDAPLAATLLKAGVNARAVTHTNGYTPLMLAGWGVRAAESCTSRRKMPA